MSAVYEVALLAISTIFFFMSGLYLLATYLKNATIVDIGWGLGFVVTTWVLAYAKSESLTLTQVFVLILVSLWGFRLTLHLGRRTIGSSEDWRYAQWRKDWGDSFWWRSYLQIFMLQGLMMFIISSSAIVAFGTNVEANFDLVTIGVFIWWIGFLIELISDRQLSNFVFMKKSKKTKEKFLVTGMWKYSRHPNYFGEVTQWWGLWIIVSGLPWGWLALVSPILITYLIYFVSGIPLLEKKFGKDPDYKKYMRTTSKFFPLPPKSN